MKKLYSGILMLAMMVAALSLTACGGSDDDEELGTNSIVGVWEVASYECSVPAESIIGDKMYLNADGTYSDPKNSGHWSLNNNQLLINFSNGNSAKYEILSLTATELSLKLLDKNISITMTLKREGTNEGGINLKQDYDILQVNGVDYACYGYRCAITYSSSWNKSNRSGTIMLPCGKLSDAKKGEYDYDYMYDISLKGNRELKKGSKLEEYSLKFKSSEDFNHNYEYTSGSATVADIRSDEYITVKFDSFMVSNKEGDSYVLNGTVQLDFDED